MAKFNLKPDINVTYTVVLTEAEMSALKLAADFGAATAICSMSKEFTQHRWALEQFFNELRDNGAVLMHRVANARKVMDGVALAVRPRSMDTSEGENE